MPTKSHDDRALMEQVVSLARQSESEQGKVPPRIGAAITPRWVVIGEAFRGELAPEEHADFTLLEKIEKKLGADLLAGATLYTALLSQQLFGPIAVDTR